MGVPCCKPSLQFPLGDRSFQLWLAGILIVHVPVGTGRTVDSLGLSPEPNVSHVPSCPIPPITHCRRSCRPSFHTNGLFSSVTDSTGPLETREKRGAVSVRVWTFSCHPPSSHTKSESATITGLFPHPECSLITPPLRVTPLLEVLLTARLLTGCCQPLP